MCRGFQHGGNQMPEIVRRRRWLAGVAAAVALVAGSVTAEAATGQSVGTNSGNWNYVALHGTPQSACAFFQTATYTASSTWAGTLTDGTTTFSGPLSASYDYSGNTNASPDSTYPTQSGGGVNPQGVCAVPAAVQLNPTPTNPGIGAPSLSGSSNGVSVTCVGSNSNASNSYGTFARGLAVSSTAAQTDYTAQLNLSCTFNDGLAPTYTVIRVSGTIGTCVEANPPSPLPRSCTDPSNTWSASNS